MNHKLMAAAACAALFMIMGCQPPEPKTTTVVEACEMRIVAATKSAFNDGKNATKTECPPAATCPKCDECPKGDPQRLGPDQIEEMRSSVRCMYIVTDMTSAYFDKELTLVTGNYYDEVIAVIAEDKVARLYTAVVSTDARSWNVVYFPTADLTKDPKKNGHFLTSANLSSSFYATNDCEDAAKEKLAAAKTDEEKEAARMQQDQCIKDVQFTLHSKVPELCPDWTWDMRRK